ncbi:MAG TPA: hydantoinase/carbamoylase family amidase [Gaiellaceae bacterium]|nr:hydantoinase/carbamoylase family amidase [Gaiellaceae bacterium]
MMFTNTERDLAESLFKRVAAETTAPEGGVCRPSYGWNEQIAWQIVQQAAIDLRLHAAPDVAGNLVITHEAGPIPPQATWIGSHLDSVPRGGNYDGLAGVVAALLVLGKAREKKCPLPMAGIGLRGEESAWFGVPYLGSKAILGKLERRDLDRLRRVTSPDGQAPKTLGACMDLLGIDGPRLVGNPVVAPDQIAEFWELHIEQGPVLVAKDKPVGVVTGIRGSVRAPGARLTGIAGHSGTTPHDLRSDAVVRFVEVMTKLEKRRQALAEFGDDLVFTCGIVGTDPKKHSITTIADEIRFALDVRSLRGHHAQGFLGYAESLGVDLGEIVTSPAAEIPQVVWQRARRACDDLKVDYEVMPSGAGHDAAVFQQAGVPSGMIFVRNDHGSHNPAEAMSTDDFLLGCEVLWRTITEGR